MYVQLVLELHRSAIVIAVVSICIRRRHFCHAPLGLHCAKRRHQSPEWTILSHVSCFIQGEVLLDSFHLRSMRASQ